MLSVSEHRNYYRLANDELQELYEPFSGAQKAEVRLVVSVLMTVAWCLLRWHELHYWEPIPPKRSNISAWFEFSTAWQVSCCRQKVNTLLEYMQRVRDYTISTFIVTVVKIKRQSLDSRPTKGSFADYVISNTNGHLNLNTFSHCLMRVTRRCTTQLLSPVFFIRYTITGTVIWWSWSSSLRVRLRGVAETWCVTTMRDCVGLRLLCVYNI